MSLSFPSPTEPGCSRVQLSCVPKWGTPHFGAGEGSERGTPQGATPIEEPAQTLPRLLVTGFGPFPGAPENSTETLVRNLATEPSERFGASALRALVLPTDYRRSWPTLRRAQARFAPDIVLHFGLAMRARSLILERVAHKRIHPDRPDAAGFAPASGLARRTGPETIASTLPVNAIHAALEQAGFPVSLSDDAGEYVCNATLYRSLHSAGSGRSRVVGFVHVPPVDTANFSAGRLFSAACLILGTASAAWTAPVSKA